MADWRVNYSAQDVARIESEVGVAANYAGFDAAGHIAAVWTNSSSNQSSTQTNTAGGSTTPPAVAPPPPGGTNTSGGGSTSSAGSPPPPGGANTGGGPAPGAPTNAPNQAVASLSAAAKADLYAQVGDAMYAPNFNLAAHIEANTVNGTFRPPVYTPPTNTGSAIVDGIPVVGRPGLTDPALEKIDWLSWLSKNEKALDIAKQQLNSQSLLQLPANGSKEWAALMEETGGAAANPGFNYAAHVAAITSQKVLKGLTEAEVLALIAETGRTSFESFDLQAHNTAKQKALQLAERVVGKLAASGTSTLNGMAVNETDLLVAEKMLLGTEANDVIDESDAASSKSIITAGAGNDAIKSGKRDDVLIAGSGNDTLDGGAGIDVAVLDVDIKNVQRRYDKPSGKWIIESTTEGRDELVNVERINANDKSVALDIDGNAGQVYRVYKAVFNRDPMAGDTSGLGYWIKQADAGMSVVEVSARFIDSNEFRSSYGTNSADDVFLSRVYENVLGRAPDPVGKAWWLEQLKSNPEKTREKILADFAESTENKDAVIGVIGSGIVYDPWLAQ